MTQQSSSDIWVLLKQVAPFSLSGKVPGHLLLQWQKPCTCLLPFQLQGGIYIPQQGERLLTFYCIETLIMWNPFTTSDSDYHTSSSSQVISKINWNGINFLDISSPGTPCDSLPSQPALQSTTKLPTSSWPRSPAWLKTPIYDSPHSERLQE